MNNPNRPFLYQILTKVFGVLAGDTDR